MNTTAHKNAPPSPPAPSPQPRPSRAPTPQRRKAASTPPTSNTTPPQPAPPLPFPEPSPKAQTQKATPQPGHQPGPDAATSPDDPAAAKAASRAAFGKGLSQQAAVMENVFFPTHVRAGLGLEDTVSINAVRLFLIRFREEAGRPQDSVEKLLLDQLAVAHLKVGELYDKAASATQAEFKQIYHGTAVQLLHAICRLVSTLASYRNACGHRPRPRPAEAAEAVDSKQASLPLCCDQEEGRS